MSTIKVSIVIPVYKAEKIIPELRSIYNNAGTKPVVKFYEGYSGIKIVLQDVIESFEKIDNKEYYVYSSSAIKDYLYNVYPEFSDDRINVDSELRWVRNLYATFELMTHEIHVEYIMWFFRYYVVVLHSNLGLRSPQC